MTASIYGLQHEAPNTKLSYAQSLYLSEIIQNILPKLTENLPTHFPIRRQGKQTEGPFIL